MPLPMGKGKGLAGLQYFTLSPRLDWTLLNLAVFEKGELIFMHNILHKIYLWANL